MKFANISDLHLTDIRPKNRKDKDYLTVGLSKFTEILQICIDKKIHVLVITGDVFDYATVPRYVVTEFQRIIKHVKDEYNLEILVIAGQHDLRYHVPGLKNTPLGNVISSGLVTLLSPDKRVTVESVDFVGCSWNEKPEISGDVLVVHRMVTEKGPLWPGQTDFVSAPGILHQNPSFQYIISGDNHKPHTFQNKARWQVNCGSVMRSKKDQTDHKPSVWIIDTLDSTKVEQIPITIEPPEDVFDYTKMALEETKQTAKDDAQEKIDAFVKSFDQKPGERIEFKTIVQKVIKDTKPNKEVISFVDEILEKIS